MYSIVKRRTLLLAAPSFFLGAGLSPRSGLSSQPSEGIRNRSSLTAARQSALQSLWTGAATPDSIVVAVRLADAADVKTVRLAVWTDAGSTSALNYSNPAAPDQLHRLAKLSCSDLTPDSSFHYAVECDGVLDMSLTGRFRTPPVGAHSFSFAAGSCAATASNAPVFDSIRARADDGTIHFFQHLGDMHYHDIAVDQASRFHAAFDSVFASDRQDACWRAMPTYYMWDDHDYGPNDAGRDSPSRRAALAVYRTRVPSPPLMETAPEVGVYHSHIRGRVRFIVTDLRSEAAEKGQYPTNDPRQVMMSARQLAWFKAELLAARDAGQAVIWISTRPWIGRASDGADGWGGFDACRRDIVNFIGANNLSARIAILSGDMHALAYDNGTNAPAGVKVMHAAPLDGNASHKGGPFTTRPRPNALSRASQYGLVDVLDDGGDDIAIRFRGIAVDPATASETAVLDRAFSLAAAR